MQVACKVPIPIKRAQNQEKIPPKSYSESCSSTVGSLCVFYDSHMILNKCNLQRSNYSDPPSVFVLSCTNSSLYLPRANYCKAGPTFERKLKNQSKLTMTEMRQNTLHLFSLTSGLEKIQQLPAHQILSKITGGEYNAR